MSDACVVHVKPDVFEWLTGDDGMALRLARVYRYPAYLNYKTGICARCRQLVPVGDVVTVGHYPADEADAYGPGLFCSGSNEPPTEHFDDSWRETLNVYGELTDLALGERRAILTITWSDDLPGDEIRRLSRSWAAKISEKPVVEAVHVKTFETLPEPQEGSGT